MKSKIEVAEFERIVREHHAAVYGAALRVARDDSLARDATQQTFMHVLQGEFGLDRPEEMSRVLRRTAAREALMLLRSDASRRRREQEHAMQKPESFEDTRVEHEDTFGALRRCVASLPGDLRHAIVLRFEEGLSYADVAVALDVSEPSAHERVQKALGQLREKLTRIGLAAMIPDLDELLARREQLDVPPGLQKKLLAMPRSGFTKLLTLPVIATAASVALVAALAINSRGGRTQEPSASMFGLLSTGQAPVVATPDERREVTGTAPDLAALGYLKDETTGLEDPAQNATGVLEGRVVDLAGVPIEGVRVEAYSTEREGKGSRFGDIAVTARDGLFHFELPVAHDGGQDYEVSARTDSAEQHVPAVRVRAGATAPFQRVQLEPADSDRPGDFQLEVTVADARGAPVVGAVVRLHRPVKQTGGWTDTVQEGGGLTDARGVIEFSGARLGAKVLRVDARSQGFALSREQIEIAEAGSGRRKVALTPGLAIRGTIVDDRGAPLATDDLNKSSITFYATADDENEWLAARGDGPGRFVIEALANTPHNLRFMSQEWSSFRIAGVQPGQGQLAIELKQKSDPRDHGTHDVEIHGSVVDAASGAPVVLDFLDVFTEDVPDDSPALIDRDFSTFFLAPRIAQVMLSGDEIPRPPNTFDFDEMSAGRYLVCVHVAGYAPTCAGPFELGPRGIAGNIDVRLARGATVRGVVFDEGGAPLADAYVFPSGPGKLSAEYAAALDQEMRSTASGSHFHVGVTTDAGGRFELHNVRPDLALHLTAIHPSHEPTAGDVLKLTEGGASAVELNFRRARVR